MGKIAPLEQDTAQQMDEEAVFCTTQLLSPVVTIVFGQKKTFLEATTSLFYENTWLRSALPIPYPAVVSCDMKKRKARESSHQKSPTTLS